MTTNAKLLIAAMIILAALAACSAPPDPNPTLIGPLPPAPNVGALGAPTPTFSAIVRAPTPAATGGLAGSREVRRISPADAKKLLDEGKALLYDVRSAQSYEAKHAAGALLMPIDAEGAPDGAKLPKDKTLIFYCTWLEESASAGAAYLLSEQGFDPKALYALLGGLAAWEEAGLGVKP